MSRLRRIVLRGLLAVVLLAAAATGFLWWKLRSRIEPIPAVLATIDQDPSRIRLPGAAGQPELSVAALRGKLVYFVVEGRESMAAGEGRQLNLALDRWRYAEGEAAPRGFLIGDVEGLGFLKWKLDELAAAMQREARLPVYLDYDGAVVRGFKLPKGHTAIVVLGEDGAVRFRKSGPLTAEELEALRQALGASEPPPPPPAPAFAVGAGTAQEWSTAACAGQACAMVFLSRQVSVKEVPGIPKGKEQRDSASWQDADIRLVGVLSDRVLPAGKSQGLFVGALDGVELAPGWHALADGAGGAALRAAFAIGPTETALVVVDGEGRLAFRERGLIPSWRLGAVTELMSLPPRRKQ